MAFIKKTFHSDGSLSLLEALTQELNGDRIAAAKMIDKGRLRHENGMVPTAKSRPVVGTISYMLFVADAPEINPLYEEKEFALYDKPDGLLVHPNKLSDEMTLLDAVRHRFGPEANIIHRLDRETSGLVLVAKNTPATVELKALFATRAVSKRYLAWVRGNFPEEPFTVDAPIAAASPQDPIRLAMKIDDSGKSAQTTLSRLLYDPVHDLSLVQAEPLTGRQHQIRLHLFHVEHPIIGEPLYGRPTKEAISYLEKQLSTAERYEKTGAKRIMLQAQELIFCYKEKEYRFSSALPFQDTPHNSLWMLL